jgi:hypothetical protein
MTDPLPDLKDALFAAMAALAFKRLRMTYVIRPRDIYLTDVWEIDADNRELNWINPPAYKPPLVIALLDAIDAISEEIFVCRRHQFADGTGSGRLIADARTRTIAIQDTVAVVSELKANTFL